MDRKLIKEVLSVSYDELLEILPVYITGNLVSKKVISWREKSDVDSHGRDEYKAREELIKILMKKENEALDILISELKKETAYKGVTQLLEETKRIVEKQLLEETKGPEVSADADSSNLTPAPIQLTPTNQNNNPSDNLNVTAQHQVQIARLICTSDVALSKLDSISQQFLHKQSQAGDRHLVKNISDPEQKMIQILQLHQARNGVQTLGGIADLLGKADLISVANQVRTMTLEN